MKKKMLVAPPIEGTEKLVKGKQLLENLFTPESRPSLRWLDRMKEQGKIPYVKLGALVFYSPAGVRAALGGAN